MKREPWDYEKALEDDKRFERDLPGKEIAVGFLVLAVLAVRVFLG